MNAHALFVRKVHPVFMADNYGIDIFLHIAHG